MLKRSFAEFHAQKKLPEKQQLLMRKLAQPTRTIEYVYYNMSVYCSDIYLSKNRDEEITQGLRGNPSKERKTTI